MQNAPVESSTALTATLFVKNPKFDPDPKNVVITKLFAPKFCAECTDRELHSSHGDPFRELFDLLANRISVRTTSLAHFLDRLADRLAMIGRLLDQPVLDTVVAVALKRAC